MNLLLDTNVFLHYFLEPAKLKRKTIELIASLEEDIFLSSASVWEMAIKSTIGRLTLPGDLAAYVRHRMQTARFSELAIRIHHALAVRSLPMHHSDPFDRILIAQAQIDGLTLLTTDRQFAKYDVRVLSA